MSRYEVFYRDVELMEEAWREQGLTTYRFWYGENNYGELTLYCPSSKANGEEYEAHVQNGATYMLFYNHWMRIRQYFQQLPEASKRYLVRKLKWGRRV